MATEKLLRMFVNSFSRTITRTKFSNVGRCGK